MKTMNRSESPIISSEVLANQLSSKLGVYIDDKDVSKHPCLAHLLDNLSEQLTSSGVLQQTETQLNHTKNVLCQARKQQINVTLLHTFCADILYETSKISSKSTKSLIKIMSEMCEALTLCELKDYVDIKSFVPASSIIQSTIGGDYKRIDTNLMGVSRDDLVARAQTLATKQHVEKLAAQLEIVLTNKWNEIACFVMPDGNFCYDSNDIDEITNELIKLQEQLHTEKYKLRDSRILSDIVFNKVCKLLLEYGGLLGTIIQSKRLSNYPRLSMSNTAVSLEAQVLKLRCIEMEVLCSTYTKKTVPELRTISSQLEERQNVATCKVTKLKHQLSTYSSLDPTFVALLEEYSKLCRDIEFCKNSI